MIKVKCPVCGFECPKKGLIFHMRKKAVFEIYQSYLEFLKGETEVIFAPHQDYIDDNSTTETKFSI